jgi:hypothetical protein
MNGETTAMRGLRMDWHGTLYYQFSSFALLNPDI